MYYLIFSSNIRKIYNIVDFADATKKLKKPYFKIMYLEETVVLLLFFMQDQMLHSFHINKYFLIYVSIHSISNDMTLLLTVSKHFNILKIQYLPNYQKHTNILIQNFVVNEGN